MTALKAENPNVDLAERWVSTVRHVTRVDIDVDTGSARVLGIRSRLPFEQPVPLSLARGLAELGYPTTVHGVTL